MDFTDESSINSFFDVAEMKRVFQKYEDYTQKTLSGEHGKTAQFWIQYVGYVDLFLFLERAVRTNDIDLFVQALTPITDIFLPPTVTIIPDG